MNQISNSRRDPGLLWTVFGLLIVFSVGSLGQTSSSADANLLELKSRAMARLENWQETADKRSLKKLKDLTHRNPERRAEAAEWFGLRKEEAVTIALISLLNDNDETVRVKASRALWQIGAPSTEVARSDLVATLAGDPSGKVRINAAGALWKLGEPSNELVPHLERGLDDASHYTRVRTATLMVRLGAPLAPLIPIYEQALTQSSENLRRRVVKDILDFDDKPPALIPVLLIAIKDQEESIRALAIITLQVMGAETPRVSGALQAATSDRSESVRSAALAALAALGQTAALSDTEANLLRGLVDRKAAVRVSAAEGLGETKAQSPEALEALISALNDRDDDVRAAAADALGELGDVAKPAIPQLRALWENRSLYFTVRHAAGRALGNLGEPVDWSQEG